MGSHQWGIGLALVIVGCGGAEGGEPPGAAGEAPGAPTATEKVPTGSVSLPGADAGGVATSSFTAAQVRAAEAKCGAIHGSAVTPDTWGDFRGLLVNSWLVCPPGARVSSVFGAAITFLADGTWHHWLSDGKGGLRSAEGVVDQGTYYFPTGYDNDAYTNTDPVKDYPWVNISAASHVETPSGSFTGMVTFEGTPRRMFVTQNYDEETIELWLVPLTP